MAAREEAAPVIYWFRQDLRLSDVPALHAAASSGAPIIACFIIDEETPGDWAPGNASRWWLRRSLQALGKQISDREGQLLVRAGSSARILTELVTETGAHAVYCSQAYEPFNRALEQQIEEKLSGLGVALHCQPGALLFTPGQVLNKSGAPFKVFTPFWRHCRQQLPDSALLRAPDTGSFSAQRPEGLPQHEWPLDCSGEQPQDDWDALWQPGAAGAKKALERFISKALGGYSDARDIPSVKGTSLLSPHLHWGEISPREILHELRDQADGETQIPIRVGLARIQPAPVVSLSPYRPEAVQSGIQYTSMAARRGTVYSLERRPHRLPPRRRRYARAQDDRLYA